MIFLQGSYTGGIQNPAIAMGPSVASNDFKDHFVSEDSLLCLSDCLSQILSLALVYVASNEVHTRLKGNIVIGQRAYTTLLSFLPRSLHLTSICNALKYRFKHYCTATCRTICMVLTMYLHAL